MSATRTVRKPAVAGLFYTANARVLRREVEEMLEAAKERVPQVPGEPIGVISPHAGFMYSGETAAYAYAVLSKRSFDTAVLIGPSHREHLSGASVYSGQAFSTPLGEMAVDAALAKEIVATGADIIYSEAGHRAEHALEVQIPFLQCIRPSASVVPITMGDQSRNSCMHLARTISKALKGKEAVIIASSDLSHYHSSEEARILDARVIEHVRRYEPERLSELLDADAAEACGGGPIVTVMLATRDLGSTTATILHACNSGDVTGDTSGVVGYLSAAFSIS